jgi:hypothetical protein
MAAAQGKDQDFGAGTLTGNAAESKLVASSDEAMASLKEQAKGKTVGDTVSAAYMENGQVKVYTASVNESGIGLVSTRNATPAEKAALQRNPESRSNASNETGTKGVPDNAAERIEDKWQTIDGIRIIDGKVGGKIPVDEFIIIRQSSIKNPDADTMTLGKYTPTIENGIEDWSKPGPESYIVKAGKSSYFDLGNEYGEIQEHYDLSNEEMFDYINRLALDDAIKSNKTIRFSHNPLDYDIGALPAEWDYIKRKLGVTDKNLHFEGGFWYVRY